MREAMYTVYKVINNNFVSSVDEDGKEIILSGKGIGFQKKCKDQIDKISIEKIYRIPSQTTLNKLESLVSEIPLEHVQICTEIIEYVNCNLQRKLNDNIYITLTDHISFAIERQRLNLEYKNAMLWEIKRFYQQEYQMGLHALEIIKNSLGVQLGDDEAGFIALHIVNAELDTDMSSMVQITNLIQSILEIVRNYYEVELDEESFHYARFITHLKYFGQRLFQNKSVSDVDEQLQKMIQNNYKKDYQCAEQVKAYIYEKYQWELTGEEVMFLTIHLKRITTD